VDHIPNDTEIQAAADRFAAQLTGDKHKFQPFPIVSFYDAIDAKGNWTKEIWYEPDDGQPSRFQQLIDLKNAHKTHRQ